jgi:hypothetical protein
MSRWEIEKAGSGIEKAGSGIEKAGSGIEKAGSGIEKAGSGIEKAGSGIRQSLFCMVLIGISFASQVSASERLNPAGTMQLVVQNDAIAVSWIVDGSVFAGVGTLNGSFVNVALTEVGLAQDRTFDLEVAGSGTGKEVAGSGTGKEVAGSGTGKEVAGSGTGKEVAGSGTGKEVAGSGTGADVAGSGTGADVAGSGTGADVAGSGTGEHSAGALTSIMVAGSGTGADAIVITLPNGTAMQMEVSLGCNSASVSIVDAGFVEVVNFSNVPVFGASSFCSSNSPGFGRLGDVAYSGPIGDFR